MADTDSVKMKFKLVGVQSQESANTILEKTLKITGVQDAAISFETGELDLELARKNALIEKLLQYVVDKEEGSITIEVVPL